MQAIGLEASKAKYEMLFLQFAFGFTLTVEEGMDGHVTRRVGGGVKVDGNQKVELIGVYRAEMLRKLEVGGIKGKVIEDEDQFCQANENVGGGGLEGDRDLGDGRRRCQRVGVWHQKCR
eukprot:g37497.t1